MTETAKHRPAEGRRVRKPDGTLLAEHGADIPISQPYWARLLADGDIEAVSGEIEQEGEAVPSEQQVEAAPTKPVKRKEPAQ